jgi:hypothetical protein
MPSGAWQSAATMDHSRVAQVTLAVSTVAASSKNGTPTKVASTPTPPPQTSETLQPETQWATPSPRPPISVPIFDMLAAFVVTGSAFGLGAFLHSFKRPS